MKRSIIVSLVVSLLIVAPAAASHAAGAAGNLHPATMKRFSPVLDDARQSRTAQPSAAPSVRCTLAPSKSSFTQLEPVVLNFTVANDSPQAFRLDLGFDREGGFIFTVKGPDGTTTRLPSKKGRDGLSRLGRFEVAPHEGYSQQLLLGEWFEFNAPGVYEIKSTLRHSTQTGDVEATACGEGDLVFEITPFDEEQLRRVCEELLERFTRSVTHYQTAADAARALAAVKSPVAVPYLRRALDANARADDILIGGLETIGDAQAVRALVSILEHSDHDTSRFSQTRAALHALKKKAPDPATMELINSTLEKFAP